MIVVIKPGTPVEEITRITQDLHETFKVTVEKSVGEHKVVLGLIGDTATLDRMQVQL